MRRLAAVFAFACFAACTPGSGENGTCQVPADCQVNLSCITGLVADGGICKFVCTQGQQNCPNGEECLLAPTMSGYYCATDGGTP